MMHSVRGQKVRDKVRHCLSQRDDSRLLSSIVAGVRAIRGNSDGTLLALLVVLSLLTSISCV